MGEFYVYIHLRADSGLPFYIGKGSHNRAYDLNQRSDWWRRIADNHGVIVEFLHTGLSEADAFLKERAEIAWARKYYSMVNMCDGGEGVSKGGQVAASKEEIRRFVKEHGRLPSDKREEERSVYGRMSTYTKITHPMYDPVFTDWVRSLENKGIPGLRADSRKQEIREFYTRQGRLPYPSDECKKLYFNLRSYCTPRSPAYDQEFHTWAQSVGYGLRKRHIKTSS